MKDPAMDDSDVKFLEEGRLIISVHIQTLALNACCL